MKNHSKLFWAGHLVEELPVTEKDMGRNRVRDAEGLKATCFTYANFQESNGDAEQVARFKSGALGTEVQVRDTNREHSHTRWMGKTEQEVSMRQEGNPEKNGILETQQ